jgi:hypothetical protein
MTSKYQDIARVLLQNWIPQNPISGSHWLLMFPKQMAINWMWPSISSASGSLSGSFIGSVAGAAEEDALVPGASHDKLRAIGATELTYGNVHSWQEIQCFQT